MSPLRQRGHPKDMAGASGSRGPVPQRARPRSPPLPRPRTPPNAPQPPARHQKEYKILKEKEAAKARRKEKHHGRMPEDPRVPEPIPLVRSIRKISHSKQSCKTTQVITKFFYFMFSQNDEKYLLRPDDANCDAISTLFTIWLRKMRLRQPISRCV